MKRIGRDAAVTSLALLVVVLAVGFMPTLSGRRRCPPLPVTQVQLDNVGTACRFYMAEYGKPPASLDDLVRNRKNILFIQWGKSGTNDVWGNPIRFNPYDPSLGYGSVISYGRDGRPGGMDRDADIEVRFGEKRR